MTALSIYAQNRAEHADYGQGKAIGFSLLGEPMIVGATYKIVKDQNQIEFGAGFANTLEHYTDIEDVTITETHSGLGLSAGYNFFLGSKNKVRKHKVVKNYLSLKLGASITNVTELKPTISWRRETFRNEEQNYSRGFDLGMTYSRVLGDEFIRRGDSLINTYSRIYMRFDWNWFRS